jgi:RNA polymerase sigma-54 factor
MRQGLNQGMSHSLTMTPQLVQSIKLLQMSSAELLKHIEEEVEKNPLLELVDSEMQNMRGENARNQSQDTDISVSADLDVSQSALEEKLGTSLENSFDGDIQTNETLQSKEKISSENRGTDFSLGATDISSLEDYIAEKKNLRTHLNEQLAFSKVEQPVRKAALEIIDNLEEDGYLRLDLDALATNIGTTSEDMKIALGLVQTFDPVGIAARDLGECLAIQLQEKNHFDPAMACLLKHLDLLAKRDFETLQELCEVSLDDLLDMVDEIKALEPRPARAFDTAPINTIVPDIFVNEKPDGSFAIELNNETLPKVLVNQVYQSVISTKKQRPDEKAFMVDCLQNANWLVKSLEQRANTVLKVMSEIVRQQDGFFAFGVSHLKPLSLKQVADAIKMHESTVSRVTSNKYVLTRQGIFELKFFFTASINSSNGQGEHSAEAVRQRIRKLIDGERVEKVLSDDALVEALAKENIEIARRTVAKYREAMGLASSVQRRREKKALAARR